MSDKLIPWVIGGLTLVTVTAGIFTLLLFLK